MVYSMLHAIPLRQHYTVSIATLELEVLSIAFPFRTDA